MQGEKGLPWLKRQYHPLIVLDGSGGTGSASVATGTSGATKSVLAVDGAILWVCTPDAHCLGSR